MYTYVYITYIHTHMCVNKYIYIYIYTYVIVRRASVLSCVVLAVVLVSGVQCVAPIGKGRQQEEVSCETPHLMTDAMSRQRCYYSCYVRGMITTALHIHIYIYIYLCTHVHMHVCIYIYIYNAYTCVYIYIYTCMFAVLEVRFKGAWPARSSPLRRGNDTALDLICNSTCCD